VFFLQTNGSGVLSFASSSATNTPAFMATISGTVSIANSTQTKVQFNVEAFDTNGCYDNTTNYRFTPTTSGKYMIGAIAGAFLGNGQTYYPQITIRKNGSDHRVSYNTYATNAYEQQLNIHSVVEANGSTDYFEIFLYMGGGGSGNFNTTNTVFYGYKLIT